jgi:hypothetical protein
MRELKQHSFSEMKFLAVLSVARAFLIIRDTINELQTGAECNDIEVAAATEATEVTEVTQVTEVTEVTDVTVGTVVTMRSRMYSAGTYLTFPSISRL